MNEDDTRPRPFLSVLADAYRERRTGIVRVVRGEGRLAVAILEGNVVAFESEGLPETASDEDRELAAMLAEAFAEGEPALSQAAARQTLIESLRARDAQGVYQEGTAERPDPPLSFATEDLLREAAHTADVFLVEDVLGPLDRALEATIPPGALPETTLTPSEGFLLSRIDGALTASEVLDLVPLDPDSARRSLLGLFLAGLARFSAAPPQAPMPVVSPLASPAAEPPRARSLAEAAQQVERERALRERRELVLAVHARIAGKPNHFEVLGLGRDASEAEVKAAYFRLAKQFHPDTFGELLDLQEKGQAIFSRLGAAFEVLGHPKSRADYEQFLPKVHSFPNPSPPPAPAPARSASEPPARARRPPPSVQGAPLPPPRERSPEDLAWLAEEALKRSEALLGEGKFWEVIQVLETHVGALGGRARHRGRLVLAQAYLHNPKWLHRGEELLRAVVRDDPLNAEAYYLLGTIYKTGGLPTRAATMFRKALEARPGHRPAADELALLEKAPPPPRRWRFGGGEET